MNPDAKAPRELIVAWGAIVIAAAAIWFADGKVKKRLREAHAEGRKQAENGRFQVLKRLDDVAFQATVIEGEAAELRYELDGPWEEEPMHAWAEGAPIEEIDPENRSPSQP